MIEKTIVSPLILVPKVENPPADPYGHPLFDFGREVCSHLSVAEERERLVTHSN
jgi:hypothetical protein